MSTRGQVIFACIWTAFSSVFLAVGIYLTHQAYSKQDWKETDCIITKLEILDDKNQENPFAPDVAFQYKWSGNNYTSQQLWPTERRVDDYAELAVLLENYEVDKGSVCLVNPDNPSEAALLHDGNEITGAIVFILFGGFFTAIGIGIFIHALRSKRKKQSAISSEAKNNDKSKFITIPFFLIFACAGVAILIFFVIPKAIDYQDSKGWKETPAEVIWSRVTEHSDDDGTTYGVDIFYQYQVNGKTYRSNNMGIVSSSSSGRAAKQEKVDAHSPGTKTTCYVNPGNPHQALLERDLGWSVLFALFPLPFIAIGVIGLWYTLRNSSAKKKSSSPYRKASPLRHEAGDKDEFHQAARQEFSPRGKRIKGLFAVLFFALFWNGITSIFVTIAVKSWMRDEPEWFLTIFIIPFVVIGLGALGYAGYRFLGIFSPAPKLTLKPSAITLGETARVSWQILGGANRFNHFAIYLVGEESAEFRRGTDNVTESEIFYESALIETQDTRKMARGSAQINLPHDTMPTWKSDHNHIKWSLRVRGDVSLWADVNDQFPVTVLPINTASHS